VLDPYCTTDLLTASRTWGDKGVHFPLEGDTITARSSYW
jgi:hypothetical protein